MDLAQPEAMQLVADLLHDGLAISLRVTGASMRPFLVGGEVVTIEPVAPSAVRIGDVILTRGPAGRVLLHRVDRIRPSGAAQHGPTFQTWGDALACPDPPVLGEAILGRLCQPPSNTPGRAGLTRLHLLRRRLIWRLSSCAMQAGRVIRR
jgi:signal peptidase I